MTHVARLERQRAAIVKPFVRDDLLRIVRSLFAAENVQPSSRR